jgi:DNA polymerase-3 subunit delta
MKINHDQLTGYLNRQLAPVYIVSGDEPLLVQEACDAIRAKARAEGCTERNVWEVAAGFDWQGWLMSGRNQSLFAERQLIELRMPTGKPGTDAGNKALQAYAEDVGPDNVLLIVTGKLDAAAQKSGWLKALSEVGVWVTVWPLTLAQMPRWVQQRMQQRGIKASPQAVSLLVERVEGNPLAAVQEIEKLYLLYGAGNISDEALKDAVVDSARFDIYAVVDCALAGDARRVTRVISRLEEEGVDPILLLWALTREIRSLTVMASALAQGEHIEKVFTRFRIWDNRKALTKKALSRSASTDWQALLVQAAGIDRILKGGAPGNRWDALLGLSMQLAGKPVLVE